MKDKLIYAKDCKCIVCGDRAVCFWPVYDPDIPDNPYCRKCVDKRKMNLLEEMAKLDKHN